VTGLNQLPDVAVPIPAKRWPPPLDPSERLDTPLSIAANDASAAVDDASREPSATVEAREPTAASDTGGAPQEIDLTAEEPIEHKPSLDGPRTKLAWADLHLQLFRDEWQKVVDAHEYTFIHEVHADGLNHRYRAVAVPDLDPKWTLLLGDCIHNLRTALDQLLYELVRANGGTPALRTQFPAFAEPGGVRIQGGIPGEALRLIEGVQPYTKTFDGNRVRLINRLDLIHQQRQLPLVPCASGRRITVNFRQQRVAPQVVKSWTSDRALESGKTVHGCEYITPYYHEDPNLKVIPHLVVQDPVAERVFGRIPAPELVGERLLLWIRETFLPRFEPFFS
jgi:hypothetical protein